jgi:tetraacyldisaccharide 4'-kinase
LNYNEIRRKVLKREGLYGLLFPSFYLLSKLYCFGALLRNRLYDSGFLESKSFNLPVISVGNITAGGSGKTPLVESIYLILEESGFSPTIVCKGYRGKEKGPVFSEPEPERFGDECAVYSLKGYRTVVSRSKIDGVEFAFKEGANVVIVDDGFQHRRVKPKINLVAVDPFNPFGDNYCLPLGLLREPLSGLERADAFVITRSNLIDEKRLESLELYLKTFRKPIFRAEFSFKYWVDSKFNRTSPPEDKEVDLFCGIGNPGQFVEMVIKMGYRIRNLIVFEDHHRYTVIEAMELQNLKNPVTTEKDLIKLRGMVPKAKAPVLRLDSYGLKEFLLANIENTERNEEEEFEGSLATSGISDFKVNR